MRKPLTAVISDIHIGDNSKTCWYNKEFHESYLKKVFEHIISRKEEFEELIILGDLFDFWTYPPGIQPPSTKKIIQENPNILGKDEALDKVVTALKGKVSYVRGNHDINVTQKDLDAIPYSNKNNWRVTKKNNIYKINGCLFTHGHLSTIFNAPDPSNSIPIGHFVTRLISHKISKGSKPAWKLKGYGAPSKTKLAKSLIASLTLKKDLISLFVNTWKISTGFADDHAKIILPDGTTTTLSRVKKQYANLILNWLKKYGDDYTIKSILADANGTYMGWLTQKLVLEQNSLMGITGHTHFPTLGIKGALADDINCGYECFSEPDRDKNGAKFTFAIVETDSFPPKKSLSEVTKKNNNYSIGVARKIPKAKIVISPFKDYSCYVRIINNSNSAMIKKSQKKKNGLYIVAPKNTIEKKSISEFWLQDEVGVHGSDGHVTYKHKSKEIKFKYDCPTGWYNNKVSCSDKSVKYRTRVGNGKWQNNKIKKKDHPICVEFIIN